jgi:amino acid adenylation domain-containing protein
MSTEIVEGFRLSPQQMRIWSLGQDGPVHHAQCAIEMLGELKADVLRASVEQIVGKHEILRTTFCCPPELDFPIQVVKPSLQPAWRTIDISLARVSDQAATVDEQIREQAEVPFDLEKGPLVRATLLTVSHFRNMLLLCLPSLCADAWTLKNLAAEISKAYESDILDEHSIDEPVQYVQFSEWQNENIEEEDAQTGKEYWERYDLSNLSDWPLPFESHSAQRNTHKGACLSLEAQAVARVAQAAAAHSASESSFLLACWHAFFWRLMGRKEIIVGSLCHCRNYEPLHNSCGLFAKFLPVTCRFADNIRFSALLRQVDEQTRKAEAMQDYFAWPRQPEGRAEFGETAPPFFPIAFEYHARFTGASADGVTFSISSQFACIDRSKIRLCCLRAPDSLGIEVYYPGSRHASYAEWLARHFLALVQSASKDPEGYVSELDVFRDEDRFQVLSEWNRTETAYPRDQRVHQLLEGQARKTPDYIAVASDDGEITYRELNVRANQLAHYLRAIGVGPEAIVGICLERSLEMVAALLGTLKAGAGYLPIDPAYPKQRSALVMEDASIRVVLTKSRFAEVLPAHTARVVNLDAEWERIARESEADPPNQTLPEQVAYVLYTSGSTGRPKGVVICHDSLSNHMHWMQADLPLRETDTILQKTPFAFDASIWEFFAPLLAGARLVMAEAGAHRDTTSLVKLTRKHAVSTIQLIPSLLTLLLSEPGVEQCASLRRVYCGGEALTINLQQKFRSTLSADLINLYGPTEACIQVAYWVCKPDYDDRIVPIGHPNFNEQIYLLGPDAKPVPVGALAELHIGGVGLSRGYLNRADMTAEKFIPSQFGLKPGTRLYKTGDLARYMPDGNIEFVGRIDHQTKIRGNLVELGEVEAVLSQHPSISQAVVLAREDEPGRQHVVAYVRQRPPLNGRGTEDGLANARMLQWQAVHDDRVRNGSSISKDLAFNITGWNSSYTGLPISEDEMQELVCSTTERIESLKPQRILEIGCGAGLVLLRLAPQCSNYWGTDFSQAALDYVRGQLSRLGLDRGRVTLLQREARDFQDVEPGGFDAVILNSVIQYFPDVEYLVEVLRGALRAVQPRGFVYIGDLRSLPLLEAFHTSVELRKSAPSVSAADIRQRIRRAVFEETELIVDPEFFRSALNLLPGISQVEVLPRGGRYRNEMTCFRYDAILYADRAPCEAPSPIHLDWSTNQLTLDSVCRLLRESRPANIEIARIPNARVQGAVRAVELLADSGGPQTVGELLAVVDGTGATGIDPEDFAQAILDLPYDSRPTWLGSGGDGSYSMLFTRRDGQGIDSARRTVANCASEAGDPRPLQACTNAPLREAYAEELVPKLLEYARAKLPLFMVPSAIVLMDDFPLMPNGKIDRRALPAPDWGRGRKQDSAAAPESPTEEILLNIWITTLGIEQASVHDNFFDLGGHSLLATQVMSQVRETFQIELPLRHLFESPTVAELAKVLESIRRGGEAGRAPAITPAPKDEPLPLSFAQHRLWFLDQLETGTSVYNLTGAFRLTGALKAGALERSLYEIARRHSVLRTTFTSIEGQPVQIVADLPSISMSLASLSAVEEEDRYREMLRLTLAEGERPFDLGQGPLLRMTLLQLGLDDHVVLLTIHHIVCDNWSTGILVREIAALYEAFSARKPSPLPPLNTQYGDFAYWQRRWLRGERLEEELAYWKKQLAGIRPLDLPSDRPRPAVQSYLGRSQPFEFSAGLIQGLNALGRGQNVTLFMSLLAGFVVVLRHFTSRDDIVIGSNIANRNRGETEGLIGFFVNMLVLRTRLSASASFVELLAQVREVALQAYAHQDVPFEKLVEELQPERDLGRMPLVQVVFNFQDSALAAMRLPGLTLTSLDLDSKPARFDLTLDVQRSGEVLSGSMIYSTELYDLGTISRLLRNFEDVLRNAVEDPSVHVDALLTRLAEDDKRQRALERKGFKEARHRMLMDVKRQAGPDALSKQEVLQ